MKNSRGFTLSELLIVVAIIVILGLLVLLAINPFTYIKRANDTERKADIYKLQNALESYFSDHESYPPNLQQILISCGGSGLSPYLDKIPCDPNTKAGYSSYITPVGSTAPEHYAIYAPTTSNDFAGANTIPQCPDTLVVNATNMSRYDILTGCGGKIPCVTYYGCKSGACIIVAGGEEAVCSPNSCDADCGGVDCAAQNGSGNYVNECLAN